MYPPLDKSALNILSNLDKDLMAQLAQVDADNAHMVPWAWGFTTVGINRTRVEKALAACRSRKPPGTGCSI